MEEYKGEKISNMPVVSVVDPTAVITDVNSDNTGNSDNPDYVQTPTTTSNSNTEERVQPGFEGTMLVFALLCVCAILKRKDK
jgi:hypothetical protein